MTRKGEISRERIIESAKRLIYTKGYNQTSVADVANEVGITKGNLHYHFKSKEELLEAIIDCRMEMISRNLAEWDAQYPAPKDRLKRFVKILLNEEHDVVRYGCPMGSLNVELGKCQQALQNRAREMFDLFQTWLDKAFKQLGRKDYKTLSRHLLAMTQGAALLSYVYADVNTLKDEHKTIDAWVDGL